MNSLLPLDACVTKYRVVSYARSFFSAPGLHTKSACWGPVGMARRRFSAPDKRNLLCFWHVGSGVFLFSILKM